MAEMLVVLRSIWQDGNCSSFVEKEQTKAALAGVAFVLSGDRHSGRGALLVHRVLVRKVPHPCSDVMDAMATGPASRPAHTVPIRTRSVQECSERPAMNRIQLTGLPLELLIFSVPPVSRRRSEARFHRAGMILASGQRT